MFIKQLLDEDFINYKKSSMFIAFPKCDFKCEKECGKQVCQNSALATAPAINIEVNTIVNRYIQNDLTQALVIGGLEPFDTFGELLELVITLREKTEDDIVIYTGYYPKEITEYIEVLKVYPNIIIKFGRYIPDQTSHYDNVLGIELASDNQYAERIS